MSGYRFGEFELEVSLRTHTHTRARAPSLAAPIQVIGQGNRRDFDESFSDKDSDYFSLQFQVGALFRKGKRRGSEDEDGDHVALTL